MIRLQSADAARLFASPLYQRLKEIEPDIKINTQQALEILADNRLNNRGAMKDITAVTDVLPDYAKPDPVAPLMETLRPLYEYLLGRDADEPGLRYWAEVLAQREAKGTRADALKFVISEFTKSPGYKKETGQR